MEHRSESASGHGQQPEKPKSQDKIRSWLSMVLSAVVTFLGLAYLAAIPLGKVGTNRFSTAEAIVFAAILFFNSVLIGKLERLSISGKGVELQVREVKEEQIKQQAEIQKLRWLISYFATDSELQHLRKLAGEIPSDFDYSDEQQRQFVEELRRLRTLEMIKLPPGAKVASIPRKGNLKDYCRLTDRGEEYLKLRSEESGVRD
jgi:hypothetical protein